MRCKCCNKLMSDGEVSATNKWTKEPEDSCRQCIRAAHGMMPPSNPKPSEFGLEVESELDIEYSFQ